MKPTLLLVLASLGTAPSNAAQLQDRYVTLQAVSYDGVVSAILDLFPGQCKKMSDRLKEMDMFKYVDCLAIDYKIENQKRGAP